MEDATASEESEEAGAWDSLGHQKMTGNTISPSPETPSYALEFCRMRRRRRECPAHTAVSLRILRLAQILCRCQIPTCVRRRPIIDYSPEGTGEARATRQTPEEVPEE